METGSGSQEPTNRRKDRGAPGPSTKHAKGSLPSITSAHTKEPGSGEAIAGSAVQSHQSSEAACLDRGGGSVPCRCHPSRQPRPSSKSHPGGMQETGWRVKAPVGDELAWLLLVWKALLSPGKGTLWIIQCSFG